MKPNPVHRLPAPLEAAVQRLKLAAREAAERTIESLGLAALAATSAYQRDGLLAAQFELNRKSAVFALTFNDTLDQRMQRELAPRLAASPHASPLSAMSPLAPSAGGAASSRAGALTDWASLSLVEDREVEAQISAERFGMEVGHACEWELRELEGYVSSLLGEAGGERDRNPLRPDLVGHAMLRAVEALTDRSDTRKLLGTELARSFTALLPTTYAHIITDLRKAGVQPLGLAVRNRPAASRPSLAAADASGASGGPALADSRFGGRGGTPPGPGGAGTGRGGAAFGSSTRSDAAMSAPRTGLMGQVDPALMSLIRRLAHSPPGYADSGVTGPGAEMPGDWAEGGRAPMPANLIRAHRDELREASQGALDHLVIDVIGFLFDQILADPKVPPQMARLIARLQLPVLRSALGDASFFSSRRHPVRRFINRIASLGAAYEDFDGEEAKAFLARVKALIQEVVEGDFEHFETYERKLAELEAHVAEGSASEAQSVAAALLAEKEDQLRLRALYAERLSSELKDVEVPVFLREFITRTWSQVLLKAADQGGPEGELASRLRKAGRELFLSVQPKASPVHRKQFLAELPRLMQDLTEGMNLIRWPEDLRRSFFGQLMPAHAEALKSPAGRQLDINLMARKVEGALQRPMPSREELRTLPAVPVLTEEVSVPAFTAEELRRAGLVQEQAVDWDGQVDIDITAAAEAEDIASADAAGAELKELPQPTEAAEPVAGRALADHVQIGFAYQMYLDGAWHKVRLSHVSTARSFFIFSHGGKHKKTVSLTLRMLQRLCETGRMKAYESAYLIDRATARARRQLAALAGGAAQPART